MNPVEIEEAVSQLAAEPFDRAEFAFQFLAAFGNKKITIDRLRKGNTNQSDMPGGVLQRSNIHMPPVTPALSARRWPFCEAAQRRQPTRPSSSSLPMAKSFRPKT